MERKVYLLGPRIVHFSGGEEAEGRVKVVFGKRAREVGVCRKVAARREMSGGGLVIGTGVYGADEGIEGFRGKREENGHTNLGR
jgi:hypothetical protein